MKLSAIRPEMTVHMTDKYSYNPGNIAVVQQIKENGVRIRYQKWQDEPPLDTWVWSDETGEVAALEPLQPETKYDNVESEYDSWLHLGGQLLYNRLCNNYDGGEPETRDAIFGTFLADIIGALQNSYDQFKEHVLKEEVQLQRDITARIEEMGREGDAEIEQSERDHEIFMEARANELEREEDYRNG